MVGGASMFFFIQCFREFQSFDMFERLCLGLIVFCFSFLEEGLEFWWF